MDSFDSALARKRVVSQLMLQPNVLVRRICEVYGGRRRYGSRADGKGRVDILVRYVMVVGVLRVVCDGVSVYVWLVKRVSECCLPTVNLGGVEGCLERFLAWMRALQDFSRRMKVCERLICQFLCN